MDLPRVCCGIPGAEANFVARIFGADPSVWWLCRTDMYTYIQTSRDTHAHFLHIQIALVLKVL